MVACRATSFIVPSAGQERISVQNVAMSFILAVMQAVSFYFADTAKCRFVVCAGRPRFATAVAIVSCNVGAARMSTGFTATCAVGGFVTTVPKTC